MRVKLECPSDGEGNDKVTGRLEVAELKAWNRDKGSGKQGQVSIAKLSQAQGLTLCKVDSLYRSPTGNHVSPTTES